MNLKKAIILTGIFTILCMQGQVSAGGDVQVYVNDRPLQTEAIIHNDLTYVPLRAVGEALGADVGWNGDERIAYVNMNDDSVASGIIDKVSPSVVAIAGNYKPNRVPESVLAYNDAYAFGTGVVIKSGGVILTNAHVVNGIDNLTVIFNNGESYPGAVQYIDETSDLAVVKINKLGLTPIELADESDIVPGRSVIAIGTPISLSMRNSAAKGIISGKDVAINGFHFSYLQTDAAINSGNSGGPLVNMQGKLLGINTMGIPSADGISFSIPVDTVQYVLKQFENNGKVIYPDLGAVFEQPWEAKIGLPTQKGLTVKSGSGELLPGDEVKAVNGIAVHSFTQLHEALKDTYVSGTLSVTVNRGGQTADIQITPAG